MCGSICMYVSESMFSAREFPTVHHCCPNTYLKKYCIQSFLISPLVFSSIPIAHLFPSLTLHLSTPLPCAFCPVSGSSSSLSLPLFLSSLAQQEPLNPCFYAGVWRLVPWPGVQDSAAGSVLVQVCATGECCVASATQPRSSQISLPTLLCWFPLTLSCSLFPALSLSLSLSFLLQGLSGRLSHKRFSEHIATAAQHTSLSLCVKPLLTHTLLYFPAVLPFSVALFLFLSHACFILRRWATVSVVAWDNQCRVLFHVSPLLCLLSSTSFFSYYWAYLFCFMWME